VGQVPPPLRYYEGATTSPCPFRLVSFPHSAIPFTAYVPPVRSRRRQDASTTRRPGISYGNPVHFRKAWRQRDLPGSWMTLPPHLPCSWTPVEPMCQAITAHRCCPRNRYDEGLGNCNLSRLDHTASAVASYASCRGHPAATQGWLLAAGQLYQVVSHWVIQEGFEVLLSSFLLLRAYPGAKRFVRLLFVSYRSFFSIPNSLALLLLCNFQSTPSIE
jgi:hypothetical protein